MTMQAPEEQREHRLREWLDWVGRLITEIESWSAEQGWSTARADKQLSEEGFGTYSVPTLRVRTPNGEVHVNPVALNVLGADGRIDLEAWPALNRVKLVRRAGQWRIITDSNVPLREPWDRDTFLRLVGDLTAVA